MEMSSMWLQFASHLVINIIYSNSFLQVIGLFRNSFSKFSGSNFWRLEIVTYRVFFFKYSGNKLIIKRVKLEKIIICRGEVIIVGVEKKISQSQWYLLQEHWTTGLLKKITKTNENCFWYLLVHPSSFLFYCFAI
jgi:hypothetical protein